MGQKVRFKVSTMIATDTTSRTAAFAKHLADAQIALAETIQAERDASMPHFDRTEAVPDTAITPFLNAMRADGWVPKLGKSGSLVETQPCESCRQRASRFAFFLKDWH